MEHVWFRMCGLFGGALPRIAPDGWEVMELDDDETSVVLKAPAVDKTWLVDTPITEVKALGFSESGRLLVLGTSSEVILYRHET